MKNKNENHYFIRVVIKDSEAPPRVRGICIEGNLVVTPSGELLELVTGDVISPVSGIGEFYALIVLYP